jgi:RNA polymerase sigma-70 factor (ECF subfamily)
VSPPSEASIAGIEALRRGDPRGADWLYRAHARTVLGWVIRLGGPDLDAEDVSHEVLLVALSRVTTLQGERIEPWLFGVTRRVVANARRRARIRRFFGLGQVPEPVDPGPSPELALERGQQRRKVQEALMTLSEAHRTALVLIDLDGRTAPEAAEMLGISVGTVYSRVHHARRAFRAAFGPWEPVGVAGLPVAER